MGTSTSTGTLAAGESRTFNLAPASAVTLTLSPNVRVTITETPATVAATGLGGNASRVQNHQLAGVFTYGPYVMGGSVLVEVESNSGSSVAWVETSSIYSKDSNGNVTGLVGPGGVVETLFPYKDGAQTIFRLPSNSLFQVGTTTQGTGKEQVGFKQTNSNPDSLIRPTFLYLEQKIDPANAGTYDWHNLDVKAYGGGSNTNFSSTTGIYAIEGKTQVDATAGQTVGKTVGVFGSSAGVGTDHTLNISIGVQGEVQQRAAGTTIIGRAISAKSPTVTAGQITTAYGFYAEDVLAGLTNYAICTNAGRVRFFANMAVPAGGNTEAGVTMSSTANLGVFFGSGAPTLTAAKGSLYLRTDGSSTSTRMYVNTDGSTAWTAVTTAA